MENPSSLIINPNTGEITSEIFPGDRIRVTRKSQDEYVNSHIINFGGGRSFVKIYDDIIPLLEKYLTPAEFKMAICIAPHVSYEDCIIRENQNRWSRIISIKELAEIHNYKYDYARKLMANLKNKGVVGKHETGSILRNYDKRYGTIYTVNPFIYFRGSDIITPVYSFYENSGWEELMQSEEVNRG